MNSCIFGQLIFNKSVKNVLSQKHSMRKEESLHQMVLGQLDIHMQKYEVGHFLHAIHKN